MQETNKERVEPSIYQQLSNKMLEAKTLYELLIETTKMVKEIPELREYKAEKEKEWRRLKPLIGCSGTPERLIIHLQSQIADLQTKMLTMTVDGELKETRYSDMRKRYLTTLRRVGMRVVEAMKQKYRGDRLHTENETLLARIARLNLLHDGQAAIMDKANQTISQLHGELERAKRRLADKEEENSQLRLYIHQNQTH